MVAVGVLALFMLLNSTPGGDMAGWAIAAVWVSWRMLVRSQPIAVPGILLKILVLPTLLILTATPGLLFHAPYDAGKDLWYFTNPVLYITFGYLLFEQVENWQFFMQPMVLIGLVASGYATYNVFAHRTLLLASESVEGYRQVAGFGFGQAAIPIVLLLLAKRSNLGSGYFDGHFAIRAALYTLGTAAIVLSLSRTIILVLASGYILSLRPKEIPGKLIANGGIRLILLFGLAIAGIYTVASSARGVGGFFFEKVLNTSNEVQIQHYDTFQQINDNWRGFEGYRALRTYSLFSPVQKIIGGGFGTLVDLGFAMGLSPKELLQKIPTTHNGYMYLLVKTGVVGLLLFTLFIVQIAHLGWRNIRSDNRVRVFTGYVLLWTAFDFAMTQGVITGIYNKSALGPNLLLLGAACCSLRKLDLAGARAEETRNETSRHRFSSLGYPQRFVQSVDSRMSADEA